jgi:calcineurin-like phosphoesterase family protein
MAVFFTSDTHFGHGVALGLYRRPFASVAVMNEAIVERWNETVGPDDDVWHLGDFAIRQRPAVVAGSPRRLRRKHLLTGNNDPAATTELEGWESVQPCTEITATAYRWCSAITCSAPGAAWERADQSARPLSWKAEAAAPAIRCRGRPLGFRPVTLGEILASRGCARRRL